MTDFAPELATNTTKAQKISFGETEAEIRKDIKMATGNRMTRNILKFVTNFDRTIKNPDKIDLKTYHNMYETDETIQSGIEMISMSAYQMLGDYTHPSVRIQKFIRDAITNMKEGWPQFWDELITDGCVYGFANAEVCMSVTGDGSQTNLDAVIGINPLSGRYQLDLAQGSKTYGDISAFIQWPQTAYEVKIPASKMVTWAHKSRHSNPFGRSRLKCIWKDWVIKDQMLKAWALAMERTGSPLSWIKTANGQDKIVDEDGNEQTRAEYLLSIMEDLQNTTGFVIEENEEVGFMQVPRSVGSDFKVIVDHMDSRMYRGLLVPVLLFDTSEIGSNALAKQHFQVYIMSMANLMTSLVPAVIRSIIKLLIVANFGIQKDGDYGAFEIKELTEENLKLLSDIFYAMTQEGYLDPRLKADMDMVRARLGMTAISDKDFQQLIKWREEAEAAAMKPATDPNQPTDKPSKPKVGGRKNNPGGPQPEKPGTREKPKAPSKKQGRPS